MLGRFGPIADRALQKFWGNVARSLCGGYWKLLARQFWFRNFPIRPCQHRPKCPYFAVDEINKCANAWGAMHVPVHQQIEMRHQLGDCVNNANKLALAFADSD